jgi:hypothetical protein
MLRVFLRRQGDTTEDVVPSGARVIADAEAAFTSTDFAVTEEALSLVHEIEGGTLLDRFSFLDCFGYKLPTTLLSTGCKAALLVCASDAVVDLKGCGWNAREAILSFCREGSVVMDDPDVPVCAVKCGTRVEIECEGHVFHTVEDFSEYLEEGRVCGSLTPSHVSS